MMENGGFGNAGVGCFRTGRRIGGGVRVRKMRRLRIANGLALLLMWGAGMVFAKDETPDWKESLTVVPPGEFPMLGPAVLSYNVSWNGVFKAGQADIVFGAGQGESIETRGVSRSSGPARVLWPYDAKVESQVDATRLLPLEVNQWEADREEENIYRTIFSDDEVRSYWATNPKKAGKPKQERERVFEEETVYDLISGVLYLRSFAWNDGAEPVSIVVFPFRDPYLVTARLLGREKRMHEGEAIDAMKFDLKVSKIRKNGSLEPMSKQLKSAHFWIGDDEFRLPLEIRAEIFVGSIRVQLTRFQLLEAGAAEVKTGKVGAR